MLTFLCNVAVALCCLPQWLAFQVGAKNPLRIQRNLLFRILRRNSGTVYGREKGFAHIDSLAAYRKAVPVQDYEDVAPYIQRIQNGEAKVLTISSVRLLEPTSGSRGPVKFIPYTDDLRAAFQRGILAWLFDLFVHYPKLFLYKSYWLITPRVPLAVQSAVPVGFAEDSSYLGKWSRRFFAAVMVKVPPEAPFPEGTVSCLRAQAKHLGLISVWSPSILNSLFQDEQVAFPHVQVLSCWADASAARYVHLAHKYLPGIAVQPKGLLSTECMTSFPLCAQGNRAVLAYRSAFFEFQGQDGSIVGMDAVQEGQRYVLIVTTEGGLYRYNTHDMVEITGFYHEVPTLQFMGRDDAISDFCGEKLHETQLLQALTQACDYLHIQPEFAVFSFQGDGYVLYLEVQVQADVQSVAAEVERQLCGNYHYANCRALRQLPPLGVIVVHTAIARYSSYYQQQGMRLGDIKIPLFDAQLGKIFTSAEEGLRAV